MRSDENKLVLLASGVAFAHNVTRALSSYANLPAEVKKRIVKQLGQWNLTEADIEGDRAVIVSFDAELAYVCELSGTPAEHFDAVLIDSGTELVGTSISVSK